MKKRGTARKSKSAEKKDLSVGKPAEKTQAEEEAVLKSGLPEESLESGVNPDELFEELDSVSD
jgi:hypothetical protein